MKTFSRAVLILSLVVGGLLSNQAQDKNEQLILELQKKLDAFVQKDQLPGILFTVRFDDKKYIQLAAGHRDKALKPSLEPQDRMLSGSTGKLFFAAVALKLIDEGKLKLDDPVSLYVGDTDWFKTFPNHADLRIINLMNHTTGLPRHVFQKELLERIANYPLEKISPVEAIKYIAHKPAVHPTGKGWAYSDTNFILLGLVLEKITQKTVYELVDEHLLQPLKLVHTYPQIEREIPGLVQGHIGPNNPFGLPEKMLDDQGKLVLDPSFEWTGGGFATNPADLTQLLMYVQESDFLSPETKKLMQSAVSMKDGSPSDKGYGLGTFVWNRDGDIRYGHSGFFPGYVTHCEYSTKHTYAVGMQINYDGAYRLMQPYLQQLEEIVQKHIK